MHPFFMFIHKSVFIITSEGDTFKGKGSLHRMKGSFSAFKKIKKIIKQMQKKKKNPKKPTPELFQYYWYTVTQVEKEKESYTK